jgi:exodeoxyribonuclease X
MLRVLDTETTGLNGEVVEIAHTDVFRMTDGEWTIGQTRSWLVDPGCLIEFGAMATHHIVDEDVKGKPLLSEVIRDHGVYEPFTHKDGTVDPIEAYAAHVASFDRERLANLAPTNAPWICTWKVSLRLAPKLDSHKNWAMAYALRLKLDPARAHPPHRAGADTFVTASVLVRALAKLTIADMIEISSQPALLYRCRIAATPIGGTRNDPKLKDLTFDQIDAGYLRWIVDTFKDDEDMIFTCQHELRRRGVSL